jgi:voltage-gated potassium channel Kch
MDSRQRFTPPFNAVSGVATTFLSIGMITAINLDNYTASVFTNNGPIDNVQISMPFYSQGTGFHMTPAKGDKVLLGYTSQNDPIIIGYLYTDGVAEHNKGLRVVTADNSTICMKSKLGSAIYLDSSARLTTNVQQEYVWLSNNPQNPATVISSPKLVEVRVGGTTTDTATVIKIIEDDNNINRLTVHTPEGVTISIDKNGGVTMNAKTYNLVANVDSSTYTALQLAQETAQTAGAAGFTFDGIMTSGNALIGAMEAAAVVVADPAVLVAVTAAVTTAVALPAYPFKMTMTSGV